MKLSEIKALQGLEIVGDDREITGVNTLSEAKETELCFWNDKGKLITNSKIIIMSYNQFIMELGDDTFIYSPDPKLTMAKVIIECFDFNMGYDQWHDGAITYLNTEMEKNIVVQPNAVIGGKGFGYVWDKDHWLRFPHIGSVVLEENVEIGSNTCIDRGSIGNTIIRKGVKIDNLVHIAHNADIGEHSLIVAGAVIGGSVKIGKNCFIGMNASIKNGVVIGDNVTVGAGAVVLKDIPSGETWAGVPAKKL